MLRQRVLTAIVLLAILLPAIFIAPPWVWGAVSLAFLAVAAHEWVCLLPGAARSRRRGWGLAALLVAAGLAVLIWRQNHEWPPAVLLLLLSGLGSFWVFGGASRLRRHEARAGGQPLVGVLLFGCWLALYELRLHGTDALVSSMAVVWIADIAAFFVGRAFGRRKLAPSISPGKSWEGALGGAAAVVLTGLAVAGLAASVWPALGGCLPARLVASPGGALAASVVLASLAALSVVGDLHESLLKRQAGVKDSGWILPGHGGVLDRIDALIPTMPVALLVFEVLR
jgi:phosphatidate cytidylyltransferase